MIDWKYETDYSEIIANSLDMYSDDTTLRVSDTLQSGMAVIKIKKLIQENLTEEEFLNRLDKEFPEK